MVYLKMHAISQHQLHQLMKFS